MLVTLLTQSMAVAFDSFSAPHLAAGGEAHHHVVQQKLVDVPDSHPQQAPSQDADEHCSHCIEHGSHAGLITFIPLPQATPRRIYPPTKATHPPTNRAESLYRPPIS